MLYDLSMLKKLSDNDESFIKDMLQTFKRTSPPIVERMEEDIVQQKYEALGREAHKMIPGVSFLGAKELETLLITIEENTKNNTGLDNMANLVTEVRNKVHELIACFEKDFNI
jgi:HPt (histidine-containing phosphotransfer) domain-containing protein